MILRNKKNVATCMTAFSPTLQKSWENNEKTENLPQPPQNENIFVKIGE